MIEHLLKKLGAIIMNKIFQKILQRIFRQKNWELNAETKEYLSYFDHLFERAARTSGFQYICTLLRVEGIKTGHWDPYVEAEDAAHDFSEILRSTRNSGKEKRALRMALLIYCHLTEMSAPYEILANLLRCIQGKQYSISPFVHLVRVKKEKNGIFAKRCLPSPKTKIKHLRELAGTCGEERMLEIIDGFFQNDIRNAFYHSDYAITEEEFRIAEGSNIGEESVSLEELTKILTKCFAFYSAFMITINQARKNLAQGKRFHRWPNYEVIEMLSDSDGLTGFKIHFPNNSYAMFERKKYKGTTGLNFLIEKEGISLMVGNLKKYEEANDWYVNGEQFEEYGTRYNQYGFWMPIVFHRNSIPIQRKVIEMTKNKIVQGLLFYIFTTGHAAIEFVVKSDKPIIDEKEVDKPVKINNLELTLCKNPDSKNFLYDGTVYLKSKDVTMVESALENIKKFMDTKLIQGLNLEYRLKYQLYNNGSEERIKKHDDGTFSFTISMDDPRSTLVTTNLGMFPKSDWHIREEWV